MGRACLPACSGGRSLALVFHLTQMWLRRLKVVGAGFLGGLGTSRPLPPPCPRQVGTLNSLAQGWQSRAGELCPVLSSPLLAGPPQTGGFPSPCFSFLVTYPQHTHFGDQRGGTRGQRESVSSQRFQHRKQAPWGLAPRTALLCFWVYGVARGRPRGNPGCGGWGGQACLGSHSSKLARGEQPPCTPSLAAVGTGTRPAPEWQHSRSLVCLELGIFSTIQGVGAGPALGFYMRPWLLSHHRAISIVPVLQGWRGVARGVCPIRLNFQIYWHEVYSFLISLLCRI